MRIAFLGLGPMGAAVAGLLLRHGHQLTVWNRSPERAQSLAGQGAQVAPTPAEAVREAEVAFSMLHDDQATRAVVFDGGLLTALPRGATHISLSTISPQLSTTLAQEHATHGHHYLAAPVFGRPSVAAEAKLWLVLGGEEALIRQHLPLLATFSRGHTVVGARPAAAHAAKLAGNYLITATIATFSEAFLVAAGEGVDPSVLLGAVNSALYQSTWLANYGQYMLHPPAEVTASVKLGAKDLGLFLQTAHAQQSQVPLAEVFREIFAGAIGAGLGDADWAGGLYQFIQQSNATEQNAGSHDQA